MSDPRLTCRGTLELLDYLRDVVWNDSRSSDIVVECFGVQYHLHKLVLSRCPYFRSMFSSVWEESRNRKVLLDIDDPDIDGASVQLALQFLYGFTLEFRDVGDVLSLYACASFLAMDSLREQCRAFLIERLDFSCVDRYYRFFRRKCYVDGEPILKACRTLLIAHAKDRPPVLLRLPPDLLVEVLSSDALCVRSEYDRFLLVQWLLGALDATVRGEAQPTAGEEECTPGEGEGPASCSARGRSTSPLSGSLRILSPDPLEALAAGAAARARAATPAAPSSSSSSASASTAPSAALPSAPPASPATPSATGDGESADPSDAAAACDREEGPASASSSAALVGGDGGASLLDADGLQQLRDTLLRQIRYSAFTYKQLFEARAHGPVEGSLLERGMWRKEYARTVLTRCVEPVPSERFEELRWWSEFPKAKISMHSTFSDVTFAFGSLWKLSVRVDVKEGKSALACFLYRESVPGPAPSSSSGGPQHHGSGYEYVSMHRKFRYSFCLPDVDCEKKYSGTQEFLREKGDNWGFPRMYEYGTLDEIVRGPALNIAVCLLPVL